MSILISLSGAAAALVMAFQTAGPSAQVHPAPTPVEDVEILARPTPEAARAFVETVTRPVRGRRLARWHDRVCPGAVNLQAATAQAIVDRISDVAADLGLRPGEPGCDPNLVVVFTQDGAALARRMVERDREIFDTTGGGLSWGASALDRFQTDARPVRWWPLSVPMDNVTGQRAMRLPGDHFFIPHALAEAVGCIPPPYCPLEKAPLIAVTSPSRLNTQIEEHLYKVIIIVDLDLVGSVNTAQLGDYLAMVGLAQIDPEGETGGFDTVLNLFDAPGAITGLTGWDRSYLQALYGSPSMRRSANAQAAAVAEIMARDRGAEAPPP